MGLAVRDDRCLEVQAGTGDHVGNILPQAQGAVAVHQVKPVEVSCAGYMSAAGGMHAGA